MNVYTEALPFKYLFLIAELRIYTVDKFQERSSSVLGNLINSGILKHASEGFAYLGFQNILGVLLCKGILISEEQEPSLMLCYLLYRVEVCAVENSLLHQRDLCFES